MHNFGCRSLRKHKTKHTREMQLRRGKTKYPQNLGVGGSILQGFTVLLRFLGWPRAGRKTFMKEVENSIAYMWGDLTSVFSKVGSYNTAVWGCIFYRGIAYTMCCTQESQNINLSLHVEVSLSVIPVQHDCASSLPYFSSSWKKGDDDSWPSLWRHVRIV